MHFFNSQQPTGIIPVRPVRSLTQMGYNFMEHVTQAHKVKGVWTPPVLAIWEGLLSRYSEFSPQLDLWQSLFTHRSWIGSIVLAVVHGVVAAWAR